MNKPTSRLTREFDSRPAINHGRTFSTVHREESEKLEDSEISTVAEIALDETVRLILRRVRDTLTTTHGNSSSRSKSSLRRDIFIKITTWVGDTVIAVLYCMCNTTVQTFTQ